MQRSQRLREMREIFIPHPKMKRLAQRFNEMRDMARATRGTPQKGLRVLGPSGAGKTSAVSAYIRDEEAKGVADPQSKPLLVASLSAATTTKGVYENILTALGDPFSGRGTENKLRERVNNYLRELRTEIVFIDEVQHLVGRAGYKTAWNVTEVLKRLLDDGVSSFVFLGTQEASVIFDRNAQLNNRLLKPEDITPILAADPEEFKTFQGFIGFFQKQMLDKGIVGHGSVDLFDSHILAALHEVSGGVLGVAVNLLAEAVSEACEDESEDLLLEHLGRAIDNWAIPFGFARENPLVWGRH